MPCPISVLKCRSQVACTAICTSCISCETERSDDGICSIFGDAHRLLDIWPAYSRSPILQEFFWSPLVELAFDTNRELFSSTSSNTPALASTPLYTHSSDASPSALRYTPIPGLLALHVRRGDFEEHCVNLAKWRSIYVGFNSFPEMPDHFEYPPGTSERNRIQLYRPHCYVGIADIVRRVQEVRDNERAAGHGELRDIYLMTNAPEEWIAQVKVALSTMPGHSWRSISSSRDLVVNREQQYVKQAVDMLIGQRAQVFLGNGVSASSFRATKCFNSLDTQVLELVRSGDNVSDGKWCIPQSMSFVLGDLDVTDNGFSVLRVCISQCH